MMHVSVPSTALWLALSFSIPCSAKVLLSTAAQDSSPKYFKKDGKMSGYCADILRALESIDPELDFVGEQSFLPFPRILKKLEVGEIDIFCGLQRNKEREKFFEYLGEPLILIRGKLVIRAQDVVEPNALSDIPEIRGDTTVLTVLGTGSAAIAKKVPRLKVDDSPFLVEQALKMLVRKRGRFVFYQDMALDEAIKKLDIVDKVRVLPHTFYHEGLYMGVSKKVSPAKIERLRLACLRLHASGKLHEILSKYPVVHTENYPKTIQ